MGFVPVVQPPYGEKFHVRYVTAGKSSEEPGEHLESAAGAVSPTDPFVETFADEDLPASEAVQELIRDGKATFTRIEDGPGYSILKDLESFAYKDDGVAILQHNAEQPYFLVLFGERTNKDLMPKIGKALSEFQREHFRRGHGGRPPNAEKLKKALALDRKPIPNKAKGAELAEGGDEKTSAAPSGKFREKRA